MGARTPVFVKTLRQEGTWALKDVSCREDGPWSDPSGLWGLCGIFAFYPECHWNDGFKQGVGVGQWWWWCLDPVTVLKRFSGCCVEDELRTALVEVSSHLGGHCRSAGELGFER